MKLIFHGGAYEVGKSCVELVSSKGSFLLDAGLKLTHKGTVYPEVPKNIKYVKGVFISHAHLDHTGALPLFENNGLNCPIFSTATTKDIARILLRDSFKVGRITHQHLGYSKRDIKDILELTRRIKVHEIGTYEGIDYEYFQNGHIPGSVSILLNVDGKSILYTGDIKNTDTKLMSAADTNYPDIDVLICESTYGNREHPSRESTEKEFVEEVKRTLKGGGSVIIPSFAVGRAQEILMVIANKRLNVPIFLDGMAVRVTQSILNNPASVRNSVELQNAFDSVTKVTSQNTRFSAIRKQAVYITTSGMLDGGPALFYIKNLGHNPKNSILLTGYQAEESNGRSLLDTGEIKIDDHKFKVNSKVTHFDFSAHAGQADIKRLVRKVNPSKLIFMHGDASALNNLKEWAQALEYDVEIPKLGDIINI